MRQILPAIGVLLLSLIVGCASDPKYFLSLEKPVATSSDVEEAKRQACTVYLSQVVSDVLHDREKTAGGGELSADDLSQDVKAFLRFSPLLDATSSNDSWTLLSFQAKLEHHLDSVIRRIGPECQQNDKSLFQKWLVTYSSNGVDPDQDFDRFEEYLESVKRVAALTDNKLFPIRAQEDVFKKTGVKKSQWCGDPNHSGCRESDWRLYKLISMVNPQFAKTHQLDGRTFEDVMGERVKKAKSDGDSNAKGTDTPIRFFVLGYELPLEKQQTEIRYGITFYFEQISPVQSSSLEHMLLRLIGYRLIYANEATPRPWEHPDQARKSIAEQRAKAMEEPLAFGIPRSFWYATGYPIALVVGVKNAVFEIAKVPVSWLAGALGGRDPAWTYPKENVINAYKALYVEATNLPSYGLFPGGVHTLLSEVPLVGQIFQLNTGPEHEPGEIPSWQVARKLFLSRGIYGGDEAGQDTGLWAARARESYPSYDIYAPPYKHGTVTDVLWSMFNLSHGPAYAEAKYVMDVAGPYDHLYLSGHSGGVQRSASASRILAHHGYSVVKVVGIAGPSIGQAYVDTRIPNSFQIFLNSDRGANEDIVSQIGQVASGFSTIMQYAIITPLRYTFGFLTAPVHDIQRCTYEVFDHMGFSNAVVTEVPRKRSTLHQTPLRLSLNEPIVFDAYVRTEFEMAFREDLVRPNDAQLSKLFGDRDKDGTKSFMGTNVPSSKGCTLFKHESGAVLRWNHGGN